MFNITTLNSISDKGLSLLDSNFNISSDAKNPDGIIVRSFKMNEEHLNSELLTIARAGAGVNNIPVNVCSQKGIVVFNTPGANANAVKELVVAGLMLSSRKIIDGINWTKTLKGTTGVASAVEAGKGQFTGPEVYGKKICVIGLGAIGVMVANIAKSLGMEVSGYDPYISVDAAWGLSRAVSKATDLNSVLADCDYVTLHLPLTEKTKNMFNNDLFGVMKKDARLLNFSRAELVDTQCLKEAIDNGTISCYVTDFPTQEILEIDKVIAIPHLGASTPESEENCAEMASKQLKDYLELGNIVNSVNFPTCILPKFEGKRVCVLHENIPNTLGPITSVMPKYNINIETMQNVSKGNLAYTVIDIVNLTNEEALLKDIEAIHGIIKVRILELHQSMGEM